MEERNSLYQYVVDMEKWLEQFQDTMHKLEKNPSIVFDNETLPTIHNQLNKLMTDVNYYKNTPQALYKDIMNDLQNEASALYNGYRSILQSNSKKKEQKSKTEKKLKSNAKKPSKGTSDIVPIGEHKLPPLPYPYDALEPYIDSEIMKLHHQKHHQSYVDGLNKAEKEMEKARKNDDYNLIKHWEREASFHGAGHYLHAIFWDIMNPKGGGKPKGELMECIKKSFHSFESFKRHFSEAAKNVEGVGWAILVWSPRSHRLEILQSEKHQVLTQWDVIPLLVLDVWEHAYYLQYKNKRDEYVDNWWNVVCWDTVSERLAQAKKVKWQPY
uniref:superoxide dismutase n=1 Tax=uncultured Allobacillus sp. TaxID=1638025 RepID=UPI002598ECDC|nr:superoxide dismutase [uncultured Allobacillus sp.]